MKKLIFYTFSILILVTSLLYPSLRVPPLAGRGNLYKLFLSTVLAVSATSSADASPSAAPTPSQSQDTIEKLNAIVKEQIKEGLNAEEIKTKMSLQTLMGYVGKVNSINSINISLDTKEGTLIQITTDEKTAFIKSGSTAKLSTLALSDKIIVIGTLLKDDIILAKRIVITEDSADEMTSDTTVAKISSVDAKKKTVGLTINNQETVYTLTKKSTIKLNDFEEGQTIFAITKKYQGKDYLSTAKVI